MQRIAQSLAALLFCIALASCADNIRQAPLQVDDESLDDTGHIGLLAVHITTDKTRLKLRGLSVHDAAGELIVIPFFDNVFLKSKALPLKMSDDFVQQIAVLDLEPGTYTVTKLDLASLNDRGAQSSSWSHTLQEPAMIRVAEQRVSYLGRLTLKREFYVVELGDESAVSVKQAQNTAVFSSEYEADTAWARELYRALEGETIVDTSARGD